ncbi:MAG: PACE efflux transporter [Pseudodesulfovibrio sp.]|nr:PACE efflux transporter [Pseudodesulfovibrio sp.]
MRTQIDRLRHTILFELIGLMTCTPLASWVLDRSMATIVPLSLFLSVTAMGCNYFFNLVFDHTLKRLGHPVHVRPVWMRVLHAIMFEASLIILAVPVVAWWLKMNLWQAFMTDIGFALFFLVYAFIYNWAYDLVFPMPIEVKEQA